MAEPSIEHLLGRVFDGLNVDRQKAISPTEYEKQKRDFIFHMTDWRDDLHGIVDLLANPAKYEEESASAFLIGFLYHVIPHLNAAGRLLLEQVPDPFDSNKGAQIPRK